MLTEHPTSLAAFTLSVVEGSCAFLHPGWICGTRAAQPRASRGDSSRQPALADWLGGLDSNQDSQIQSLESYQLDDLPVEEWNKNESRQVRLSRQPRFYSSTLVRICPSVNRAGSSIKSTCQRWLAAQAAR